MVIFLKYTHLTGLSSSSFFYLCILVAAKVLLAEATLYREEGLRVGVIEFASNSGCVDLLVRGLVPLLDAQTQMAHGSDASFVGHVHRTLGTASPYLLLPHARLRHHCFTVRGAGRSLRVGGLPRHARSL
jgi:hypothetical protein